MATYIALMKWTDQGIRNYKETVSRGEQFRGLVERAKGRVVQQLWTSGDYDGLTLFEAPDDETATSLVLQACSLGNVRTTTMRAFTADEMRKLIAKKSPS